VFMIRSPDYVSDRCPNSIGFSVLIDPENFTYSYPFTTYLMAMPTRQWPSSIMSRQQVYRPPFSQNRAICMELGRGLLLHWIQLFDLSRWNTNKQTHTDMIV